MKRTPNEERAWEMLKTSVGPYIWTTNEIVAFIIGAWVFGVIGGIVFGSTL